MNTLEIKTPTFYQELFIYNPLWDGNNGNILKEYHDDDAIEIIDLLSQTFNIHISDMEVCNNEDFKMLLDSGIDSSSFSIFFYINRLPTKTQINSLHDAGLNIGLKYKPILNVFQVKITERP